MGTTVFNGKVEEKALTVRFLEDLDKMLAKDEKVVYMDADLMFAWGDMSGIRERYPDRVLRCGIAEANMIGTAAAMSVTGMKPIIHSFASFVTRRGFDQLFLTGAYAGKDLNIIGSEPGYKQTFWGGTHMCFEDIAMMRTVPGARIFDIVDGVQFQKLINQTVGQKGIFYYRVPLADNVALYDEDTDFEIGKGIVLKEGTDATIIACGRLVTLSLQAAQILENEGISVKVVDMFTVKPIDKELVLKCAKETGLLITAENHSVYGGLGSSVSEVVTENEPVPVWRIGTRDEFGEVGDEAYLRNRYHFNPEDIADKVRQAIQQYK